MFVAFPLTKRMLQNAVHDPSDTEWWFNYRRIEFLSVYLRYLKILWLQTNSNSPTSSFCYISPSSPPISSIKMYCKTKKVTNNSRFFENEEGLSSNIYGKKHVDTLEWQCSLSWEVQFKNQYLLMSKYNLLFVSFDGDVIFLQFHFFIPTLKFRVSAIR